MNRRQGLRRIYVAAAVAALITGATPSEASSPEFFASGCAELQLVVPISQAAADEFLPDDFVASTALGGPSATLVSIQCRGISIDGAPSTPGHISEVVIGVQPPNGQTGNHVYEVWQTTTNAALGAKLAAEGVAGGVVPGSSLTVGPLGARGVVPTGVSAFQADVLSPTVAMAPLPGVTNTAWHDGAIGRVRIDYTIPGVSLSPPLVGVATVPEGSPMARLLGTTQAVGVLSAVAVLDHYSGTFTHTS